MIAYLDTHVVLWLHQGLLEKLGKEVRLLLNTHELLISPAVLLEIQFLKEIKRVLANSADIFSDLSSRLGIGVCDKPFPAVIAMALTLKWTRDPFDRIIVAQSCMTDAPLVTKDRDIRSHYKRALW